MPDWLWIPLCSGWSSRGKWKSVYWQIHGIHFNLLFSLTKEKKMKMKKKIGKERKEIKIAKLVRCRFHFTEYREKYEMNSYNREYVLMKCENWLYQWYECNGLQVKITIMSKRGNISWSMTYYMTMVHVITYRKEICVVGVRVGEYFSFCLKDARHPRRKKISGPCQ